MGSKNFLSSQQSVGLVHPEFTGWLASGFGSIVVLNNLTLLFVSISLDHRSHENIIGVLGEHWSDLSLIEMSAVIRNWEGVKLQIGLSLDILIIGVRGRIRIRIALRLSSLSLDIVRSHWWSCIGFSGSPVSVPYVEKRLVFLRIGTGEFPDLGSVISGNESEESSVNQLHCYCYC